MITVLAPIMYQHEPLDVFVRSLCLQNFPENVLDADGKTHSLELGVCQKSYLLTFGHVDRVT